MPRFSSCHHHQSCICLWQGCGTLSKGLEAFHLKIPCGKFFRVDVCFPSHHSYCSWHDKRKGHFKKNCFFYLQWRIKTVRVEPTGLVTGLVWGCEERNNQKWSLGFEIKCLSEWCAFSWDGGPGGRCRNFRGSEREIDSCDKAGLEVPIDIQMDQRRWWLCESALRRDTELRNLNLCSTDRDI